MPSLLTRTIVSLAVLVSQRAPLSQPRGINVYTRFYCFTIRVLFVVLTKKRAKVRKKNDIHKSVWHFSAIIVIFCAFGRWYSLSTSCN